MTAEQLKTEAKIYGVPVEKLLATGPSVVSLNGVVASMAVMEAMAIMTSLREPVKIQTYRGDWRRITRRDEASESCFYCKRWLS